MTLEGGCFTWKTLEGATYDSLRLDGADGGQQGPRGEAFP